MITHLIQDISKDELQVCAILYKGPRGISIAVRGAYVILIVNEVRKRIYFAIPEKIVMSLFEKGLLISLETTKRIFYILSPDETHPKFFKELKVQIALGTIDADFW